MSDVIVLPPSGAPLLCQCVSQGAQKEKKIMKKNCVQVFYLKKKNPNKVKMFQAYLLFINVTFTGIHTHKKI